MPVDTGETALRATPRSPLEVTAEQELPALAQAGAPEAISEVILTHHHGDHVDGLV
jgi:glyoxylase-like metal-dependent hydrolase (beta-lactamase superfamily II)